MSLDYTGRYIDPLTDFGFKYLFGNEPHKDLLIALLNDIFQGRKKVADLQFGPNEQLSDLSMDRGVTVDLFCTGDNGERFIVEMQRAIQQYFKDRGVYYVSRTISRQEEKGNPDWDYQLQEVYFIGIMDFKFSDSREGKYFHDVRLIEQESGKEFYDKLGFIYIELPNFVKDLSEDTDINEVSLLDKWIYTLKHLDKLDKPPKFLNQWIFKKLFKIAEVGNLKKEERMQYEASLKAKRDYNATLKYAEKTGREKGREEGIEIGMEKGMEKGKEESNYQFMCNLLSNTDFDDTKIAALVGVSIELVEKVRKELTK